jgi:hypothetical protein
MRSIFNDLHFHLDHPTPVKWCSSLVVSKQMCQTIAVKSRHLFITLSWPAFHCNALRVGEAKFVTLLAAPPRSSRQLLCPSATFRSALLPLRFASPRSLLFICSRHGSMPLLQNPLNACCSYPFASIRTTLTGFHSAPLRPTFISVAFSPPAANNFARRRYPLGCGWQASVKARYLRPLRLQNAKPSLHSSAAFVPCGKYTPAASYGAGIAVRPSLLSCQPLVGARSRLRSFLPPAAFSARFARLTLQPPLLPAALLFF